MIRFGLAIDLDTEEAFKKEVEDLNRKHNTNFKIIRFKEDIEMAGVDIDV